MYIIPNEQARGGDAEKKQGNLERNQLEPCRLQTYTQTLATRFVKI